MNIYLTFDYELFFGSYTGSAEKCLLKPTEELISIASKNQVPMVFFVDSCYLLALKKQLHIHACANDYEKVTEQLRQLKKSGHEIALHIHPHWLDSDADENGWKLNTSRYKLFDFSKQEIEAIIRDSQEILREITGIKPTSFRAGGWCVQPFEKISDPLWENGIRIDSSVYPGGYHHSPHHFYDFRKAPNKAYWRFENDCLKEEDSGRYQEISITPDTIHPFFYFMLYFKMKMNPSNYKPVGDGSWLKDRKKIYKQFYTKTHHFASADGYFVSRLKGNLKKCESKNFEHMNILSHPKSLAPCSFQFLDEFILFAKQRGHQFVKMHV